MRLSSIESTAGMYGIVSFEPLAAVTDWWSVLHGIPEDLKKNVLHTILQKSISVSQEVISGVLVDPQFGLQYATDKSGLLLPLVIPKSAEIDPLAVPRLHQDWGVVEVANNYGVAVLTLFYHPQEQKALPKKQFVTELADYCAHEGIDLILDLVVYTPADQQFDVSLFQESQLVALQEFRSLAQALILQYPLDPLSCATITTELDIPWLVSSRGLRYTESKETIRTALEGGARGFFTTEAAWPQPEFDHELHTVAVEKNDHEALAEMLDEWTNIYLEQLQTTYRDQYIELMRITDEFA